MEEISCNYCGSNKYEVLFPGNFTLVKCKKCGLIYINPRPGKKSIGKYYSSGNYWSEATNADKAYGHLYRLIFKFLPTGSVFDVGAGTGLFLSGFKKQGWEIDGVELSPKAVALAVKKFKINLRNGDLLNQKLQGNIDLITFNNVLEHLHDPMGTLVKASKLLKKNGAVMVSAPNIEGLGAVVFGDRWYGIDAPRHLYQFNYLTLSRMLKRAGFKIVRTDYSFYKHNYEVLFESFRRAFSPRFKQEGGGIYESGKPGGKIGISPVKMIGVVISRVLSGLMASLEPALKRGEIMTILAIKK